MNKVLVLSLSANSATSQLIAASELLIDESISTIININIDELDNKQVAKLAKLILKQIDETSDMIDVLSPIPDVGIQRAILQLEQTINSCFVALNQHYNELQHRILTLDCDCDDLISYASFCHQLSMKLLKKASKNNSVATTSEIDVHLQQYL